MQVSPRLQKLFHLLLEACAGIFISLLILAILPLLIQKVSQHSHKNLLELSQLIPLNQEELIPDEPGRISSILGKTRIEFTSLVNLSSFIKRGFAAFK